MFKQILTLSMDTKDDFSDLLSYAKVVNGTVNELEELKKETWDLLIIHKDLRIAEVVNEFRKDSPYLPIILFGDINSLFQTKIILELEGYGPVRLFTPEKENSHFLQEIVGDLLYPGISPIASKISFIVPLYNEEKRFQHVAHFIEELNTYIQNSSPWSKILLVNDGSIDNTETLIRNLRAKTQESNTLVDDRGFIEAVHLKENTGKAGTYLEGIKAATGDFVVIVDGDGSFFVEDIARIANILSEGYYDIVAATKDFTAGNRSLVRKIMSFGKRLLTRPLLPKGVIDAQTGLKAMRRETARYLLPNLSDKTGLAIDLDLLNLARKAQFRVLQIPVRCIEREGSHIDPIRDSLAYLKNIGKIFLKNQGSGVRRI